MSTTREAPRNPHVEAAIRLCGGRQADLARRMRVPQQRVSKLLLGQTPITEHDAIALHRATGGKVPGNLVRPDLWSKPEHVPIRVNGARTRRRRNGRGRG